MESIINDPLTKNADLTITLHTYTLSLPKLHPLGTITIQRPRTPVLFDSIQRIPSHCIHIISFTPTVTPMPSLPTPHLLTAQGPSTRPPNPPHAPPPPPQNIKSSTTPLHHTQSGNRIGLLKPTQSKLNSSLHSFSKQSTSTPETQHRGIQTLPSQETLTTPAIHPQSNASPTSAVGKFDLEGNIY